MTLTKCSFSAVVVDQETFQAGIQKRNVIETGGRNLMAPSLSSGQLKKEEDRCRKFAFCMSGIGGFIPLIFNINIQLDATVTNFIVNYNQLNMFRAIISPISRNRLCLQLHRRCCQDAANRQHRRCIIPQAVNTV